MSNELLKLYPEKLWKNFSGICSVPHPSGCLDQIIKFLKQWASERNIECFQDKGGNIIMRKSATPGMENRQGVILQGHIDMVPQKNSDVQHDFTKDPISAYVDNEGWIRAKGTTLGADNGIGCSAAMAVLESSDVAHGPVEVLITVDEETGMYGALGLEKGALNGKILLNLDSETEGELYVGCAGGVDVVLTIQYKEEVVPAGMVPVKLALTGLKGGHSGMDIILGRGNANKIMMRLLYRIVEKYGLRLASIDGGSLRNAIPREIFVTAVLPEKNCADFKKEIQRIYDDIKIEFSNTESDMSLIVEQTEMPKTIMDKASQDKMIKVVFAMPNGIMRMSDTVEKLVETSTNLAIVKSNNGKIEISSLVRSSVESAKIAVTEKMRCLAELAHADIEVSGSYPGWKPNMQSPILNTMIRVYREKFNEEAEIKAIHAGLECGLFSTVYPDWDMISFGPTICNPHSPDERVNIKTVGKLWDFLVETLKNIPVK